MLAGRSHQMPFLRRSAWFVALFWCVSLRGWSQEVFHHLTTNDGLSHSTVMDIVQDYRGFLWLATVDGLNRYDGERFRTYRHSSRSSNSLSSNYINCLLEDKNRQLWAGTQAGGLNVLDESGGKISRLTRAVDDSDISSVTITSLALAPDGRVWAATDGGGLLIIDPATRQVRQLTTASSGLASDFIKQITFDRQGNLWLGYHSGVLQRMRADGEQWTRIRLPLPALRPPVIMTITSDRRGRGWVGTQGSGLFCWEDSQNAFRSVFYRPGVAEGINNARSLHEAPNGTLWLGTDDGIIKSENADFQTIRQLRHDPSAMGSLSTHATVCLRGDRQGNLWVGTWEGGLNVLFGRPDPFSVIAYKPGQPRSLLTRAVTAVAADSAGNLWVGSTQGLTFIAKNQTVYRHYRQQPGDPYSLPGNDITHLNLLSENTLLVTVWKKGTVILNPRTGRVKNRLNALGTGNVVVVDTDNARHVELLTDKSVSWKIDRFTGILSPWSPQLANPVWPTAGVLAADGTRWIGTQSNGLVEYPPGGAVPRYHHSEKRPGSIKEGFISCIFEDKSNRLWIGTLNGLYRYDRPTGRFQLFTIDSGLPNDAVVSINEDKEGFLWVATNDGLCRINPEGKIVTTYRRADGLAGNDFTENAVTRSADGTLFWGGRHGLTLLRPERLRSAGPPIPVYLTELRLFNQVVQPAGEGSPLKRALIDTKSLVLRYEQSVFTFDFSSVLFWAHRNVRYAYKLDGFESNWNYVGPQHSATYTNQSPGSYLFRVRASLTDNFDDAPETVLSLTILPPWYRTGWAYAAYALVVLLLLFTLRHLIQVRENYKTKLRAEHLETEKARELDRLRTGFFTNTSHEFRPPLTLIITPLEQLLADPASDPWRRHFQTMHRNASRLLRLINQLLDLSRLESGALRPDITLQDPASFVSQIAQSFMAQAVRQEIELRIDTDFDSQGAWFDPDILEKVLYNLLANALKFTPAGGTVVVRCRVQQAAGRPELLLEVEDTGVGISPRHARHIFERFYQAAGQNHAKKAGSGIGLALTRELVELHRGRIRVESQPGVGTVFVVELPAYAAAFPATWLSGRSEVTERLDADSPLLPSLPAIAPRASRASAPLVLIVEDHDDLRQYLAEMLGGPYRVHAAANGLQALDYARTEVPDLVVSDWLMPDMDGLELCKALKTDQRTSHVPVLMLTSRSSNESKIEGLDAGADDYITKPFNLDILLSRVRNLLQSRRLLREKYGHAISHNLTGELPESTEEIFLRKAMTFIESRLPDADLDVGLLEHELGMSSTQLYRKLKALTGKGGNELIRSVRLQQAARLLKTGGRQVAEIAYEVGFSDPNYFIRAFRKEFGVSPGEWSKQDVPGV